MDSLIKVVLIYIILINIFSYLAFYIDKRKAIKGKYRISEKTLIQMSLLGGVFGAIVAMKQFHHKTSKKSFYHRIYMIAAVYLLIIIYIIFYLIESYTK